MENLLATARSSVPFATQFMHPLKPKACFSRLQRFCGELGWEAPLVMHRTSTEFHDRQKPSLTRYFYTMYETNSPIYVQINPQTDQHPRLFAMNIYAMRYRLCTGWHGFMIDRNQSKEIPRVLPCLHAMNFTTQAGRALLRRTNPECTDYTWQRIRDSGPPYAQSSTYERWLDYRDAKSGKDGHC
jgi:hypothetical protein